MNQPNVTSPLTVATAAINVDHLNLAYGGVTAVNDVIILLGPNANMTKNRLGMYFAINPRENVISA